MTSYFCPSCGVLTINNTERDRDRQTTYFLLCGCGFEMRFNIIKRSTKTAAEIDEAFRQTMLTDNQRGTKKRFTSPKTT